MIANLTPNISLNPDASPAALRAVRSAPVSSRPEMVCQIFFAVSTIELSSGEPRRLSALR